MIHSVRHRLSGAEVLLGILLVLLTVSSMLIGMNRNGKRELEKLSRGFYTENKTKVNVDGVKKEGTVAKLLKGQMGEEGIVFRISLEPGQDIRGVCFHGDISLPVVSEGHFFSERECFSVKPLALVGRNYKKEIRTEGGKQYITIGGKDYLVTGILGAGEKSRFDEMRLINMGAVFAAYGEDGQYIFDGEDGEKVSARAGKFAAEMEAGAEFVYWEEGEELGFQSPEEAAQKENRDGMEDIYLTMMASFLIASLSGVLFWSGRRARRRQVEDFLGAGRLRIFGEELGAFLGLWLLSFLVGQGCLFLLRLWFIPYGVFLADYLIAAGVTLLPGVFLIILSGIRLAFSGMRMPEVSSPVSLSDLVLVLQFACFFWLFFQISTYYVNVNRETWVQNSKKGYQYYTLHENWDGADVGDDPAMIDNTKKVLAKLREEKDFTFMSLNRDESWEVEKSFVLKYFKGDDYGDFLYGSKYPGYYRNFPEYTKEIEEGYDEYLPLSMCLMDRNAVEHYVRRTGEGRVFSEEDYSLNIHGKRVPVMMGAAYRKYFKLGDTFPVPRAGGRTLEAEVIGFLQENTPFISDATLEHINKAQPTDVLDYSIILPYFDIEGTPVSKEDEIFLQQNYYNQLQGILVFGKDAGDREVLKAQAWINELFLANGLYTCTVSNATEGIKLFMGETRKSVNIITFLMSVMSVFSVCSLCISLVNKLNRNLYRYGVQMMNGRHPGRIFLSYMGEIFFVMLAAVVCVGYKVIGLIYDNIQFLWLLLFCAVMTLVPCVIVMAVKLRGVDMELLLRRKE